MRDAWTHRGPSAHIPVAPWHVYRWIFPAKLIQSSAQAGLRAVHVAITAEAQEAWRGAWWRGDASMSQLALWVRGADDGSEVCIVAVVLMQGKTLQASSFPRRQARHMCCEVSGSSPIS